MTVALETRNLCRHFGGFTATSQVSLSIAQGARHALIGPNGAGKTTLINLLTGALPVSAGDIYLMGEKVTAAPAWQRVQKGLARTFQINQLFTGFTPRRSLMLAVAEYHKHGWRFWRALEADLLVADETQKLLQQIGLTDVADIPVSRLPYGKQRLLEIGLALALKPLVLLLDEPAAGVPEEERHEVLALVKALPEDVTIVLIEHDMELVFSFADRISVLVQGELFLEGTPQDIAASADVRAIYLGEDG